MGNLKSVQKAFQKIGCDVIISNKHNEIKDADKIVLPGVGAFKDGMKHLQELGLIELLYEEVVVKKKLFLGICLGMQLLATKSYENGETEGLGWIEATVSKFNFLKDRQHNRTHVGWNNILYKKSNSLYNNILDNSDFYFVHSYHFQTEENIVLTTTEYSLEFISSINKENIYACQFHPEKSQKVGLKLLENFVNLKSEL